jgi:hypothetical protein
MTNIALIEATSELIFLKMAQFDLIACDRMMRIPAHFKMMTITTMQTK